MTIRWLILSKIANTGDKIPLHFLTKYTKKIFLQTRMCPLLLLWRLSTMYDKQPASQDNNSTFQCTTNSGSSETVPECADRTGGCRQIQRSDRNWLATRNRKRRNLCQHLRTLPTFYSILESSYQVLFDNYYFNTKGISCTLNLLFYFLVKFFFIRYNRYNKSYFVA